MTLPSPTKTSPDNSTESCVITGHLVASHCAWEDFRAIEYALILCEGCGEVHRRNVLRVEVALEKTLTGDPVSVARQLRCITITGYVDNSAAVHS